MTQVKMPEPVAFLNPYGGVLTALTTGLERETFTIKLITTTQAEAYADARVAESQRWISVDERLPDVGVPVLVYIPPGPDCHPGDVNIRFDFICPDYEYWHNHSEHYEHYCCVAKGGSGIEWSGPSEKAPYTHWMPLPAPPLPGPASHSPDVYRLPALGSQSKQMDGQDLSPKGKPERALRRASEALSNPSGSFAFRSS